MAILDRWQIHIKHDRLIGNEGSEAFGTSFFAIDGGDNVITGGANAELPASANTITDFTLSEDVLGIGGIETITEFDDLTLTQDGADTVISVGDADLAILLGINEGDLGADQFVIQPTAEVL